MPGKAALAKRALAELLYTVRMSVALLLAKLRRGDVALTVSAPLHAALRFRRREIEGHAAGADHARSLCRCSRHGGPPEAAVDAGKGDARPERLMFRALDAVVIIGRDTEKLMLRYRGMSHEKFRFVPNWATLEPGIRAIAPESLPPGAFRTFRCGPGLPMIPSSYSRRRAAPPR